MSRPKTHKGDEERIAIGAAERRRIRLEGIPIQADPEETSPHQTDEERASIRRKRPTQERIEKLEVKHDVLSAAIAATQMTHARMDGKLDTLVELAAASAAERERRAGADAEAATKRAADEKDATERARKHLIALIGALAAGAAIVIAAMAQGCL